MALASWRAVSRFGRRFARMIYYGSSSVQDSLLWCRDLDKHFYGDCSYAVVQANNVIEDHSQVESTHDTTFVGVYDGHGGPEAAGFISDHLFLHLMTHARENGTISEDTLRSAFSATEDGFLTLVRETCGVKPIIAATGSCCLVGVIWRGTLYVANVGDSRAVMGSLGRSDKLIPKKKSIVAVQLARNHNVNIEEVREELRSLHPDDAGVVVLKHGIWRVKGIIQGIAGRLLRTALNEAARKREMTYNQLKRIPKGVRRHFHDDMTVVVIFINHDLLGGKSSVPELSVRGFVGPSNFNILHGIDASARPII